MTLYLALLYLPTWGKTDPQEELAELSYWFEVARGGVEEARA